MREQGQGYEDKARSQNNAGLHVARGRVGIRSKMEKSRSELELGRAGERLPGLEAREATGMPFLLRGSHCAFYDRIIMLWVYLELLY